MKTPHSSRRYSLFPAIAALIHWDPGHRGCSCSGAVAVREAAATGSDFRPRSGCRSFQTPIDRPTIRRIECRQPEVTNNSIGPSIPNSVMAASRGVSGSRRSNHRAETRRNARLLARDVLGRSTANRAIAPSAVCQSDLQSVPSTAGFDARPIGEAGSQCVPRTLLCRS